MSREREIRQEGQVWRRADGAELVSFSDYTGTLAFYTPDNHFFGVMAEREIRERGYVRLSEMRKDSRGE